MLIGRADGSFTVKIADFGFSVRDVQDNTRIVFPKSPPWDAPECNKYPEFTSAQAVKADVFSFGMLCLWVMFEEYLSGVLSLPGVLQLAINTPQIYEDKYRSVEVLDNIKKRRSLVQLASELVMAEASLDMERKHALQQFFTGCLADDPQSRDIDIQRSFISAIQLDSCSSKPQPTTQAIPVEINSLQDRDFKVGAPTDKSNALSNQISWAIRSIYFMHLTTGCGSIFSNA